MLWFIFVFVALSASITSCNSVLLFVYLQSLKRLRTPAIENGELDSSMVLKKVKNPCPALENGELVSSMVLKKVKNPCPALENGELD